MSLQGRIDRLVRAFVARVTITAGEAAMAAMAEPPPDRRAKRTAAELAATRARLRAFLAAHPGQRIEQINRALGTTTAELALPIKTLIAAGTVRTEGARRATTYFLT